MRIQFVSDWEGLCISLSDVDDHTQPKRGWLNIQLKHTSRPYKETYECSDIARFHEIRYEYQAPRYISWDKIESKNQSEWLKEKLTTFIEKLVFPQEEEKCMYGGSRLRHTGLDLALDEMITVELGDTINKVWIRNFINTVWPWLICSGYIGVGFSYEHPKSMSKGLYQSVQLVTDGRWKASMLNDSYKAVKARIQQHKQRIFFGPSRILKTHNYNNNTECKHYFDHAEEACLSRWYYTVVAKNKREADKKRKFDSIDK